MPETHKTPVGETSLTGADVFFPNITWKEFALLTDGHLVSASQNCKRTNAGQPFLTGAKPLCRLKINPILTFPVQEQTEIQGLNIYPRFIAQSTVPLSNSPQLSTAGWSTKATPMLIP
ncbi:MAG: hypothetical protein KA292_09195 [Sphingorhabdus sp.]|nr:hypothetical protein [Sphingorhabdus sp.]